MTASQTNRVSVSTATIRNENCLMLRNIVTNKLLLLLVLERKHWVHFCTCYGQPHIDITHIKIKIYCTSWKTLKIHDFHLIARKYSPDDHLLKVKKFSFTESSFKNFEVRSKCKISYHKKIFHSESTKFFFVCLILQILEPLQPKPSKEIKITDHQLHQQQQPFEEKHL